MQYVNPLLNAALAGMNVLDLKTAWFSRWVGESKIIERPIFSTPSRFELFGCTASKSIIVNYFQITSFEL